MRPPGGATPSPLAPGAAEAVTCLLAVSPRPPERGRDLRVHLRPVRWRSVHLADPEGPTLRVEETFVRGRQDTPKSAAGERTIALGERVAAELFDHRARSAFNSDDERMFVNPWTGGPFHAYDAIFRLVLAGAGIADYLRPCHDLRHSSITNAAAAGTPRRR